MEGVAQHVGTFGHFCLHGYTYDYKFTSSQNNLRCSSNVVPNYIHFYNHVYLSAVVCVRVDVIICVPFHITQFSIAVNEFCQCFCISITQLK